MPFCLLGILSQDFQPGWFVQSGFFLSDRVSICRTEFAARPFDDWAGTTHLRPAKDNQETGGWPMRTRR